MGEDGLPLIKYLYSKENVSEFDLAKRAKLDIKVVRKMLYLLYNHNLVGFNRKKDKEKGWYIYYWTLIPENVKFAYYKRKKEVLARLKHRLEEENKELFFVCPKGCVRLNFDQGMDFEFHCSECGDLLNQDDNTEVISNLSKKIEEIETEFRDFEVKELERKKEENEKKRLAEKKVVKKVVKKKVTKKKVVKKAVKKVTKKKLAEKKIVKKAVKKLTKKKPAEKKVVKKKTTKKKINKKNS